MKGFGDAIDNDDSCSSTRQRIEDFEQHGQRGRNWFGRFRDHGFAGAGSLLVLHRPQPHAGLPGRLPVKPRLEFAQ
jgi:hypothetical protein